MGTGEVQRLVVPTPGAASALLLAVDVQRGGMRTLGLVCFGQSPFSCRQGKGRHSYGRQP